MYAYSSVALSEARTVSFGRWVVKRNGTRLREGYRTVRGKWVVSSSVNSRPATLHHAPGELPARRGPEGNAVQCSDCRWRTRCEPASCWSGPSSVRRVRSRMATRTHIRIHTWHHRQGRRSATTLRSVTQPVGCVVPRRGGCCKRPLVQMEACLEPVLHLVLPLPTHVQSVQPTALAATTLA